MKKDQQTFSAPGALIAPGSVEDGLVEDGAEAVTRGVDGLPITIRRCCTGLKRADLILHMSA